jgi:sugar phosphate isomerase/epimerase
MQLGIFAKTFPRPTLEETLDAIAARGLSQVQFNMSCARLPTLPERLDEDFCVWIARAFRDRGLTMAAISGTFNLCDPSESRLEENLRRLGVLAAACRWLDTRIITLCTGTLDPNDIWRWHPDNVKRVTWERLIESITKAVAIADQFEVTLAFEPEIHNVVSSVSRARRLLDEVDSPWLKVVIDPANLVGPGQFARVAEILDEAFDRLGPDIVLAHAKDPTIDEQADSAALITFVRTACGRLDRNTVLDLYVDAMLAECWPMDELIEQVERLVDRPDWTFEECRAIFRTSFFYRPYQERLRESGYHGAVVLHGLDEAAALMRVRYLQGFFERPFTGWHWPSPGSPSDHE